MPCAGLEEVMCSEENKNAETGAPDNAIKVAGGGEAHFSKEGRMTPQARCRLLFIHLLRESSTTDDAA